MSKEALKACRELRDYFGNSMEAMGMGGYQVDLVCEDIEAKREMEVDMIRFLDSNRHSNSVMRWQVDTVLNSSGSTRSMRDALARYKRGERAIYSRMVDER
jgi:hypothetical protein